MKKQIRIPDEITEKLNWKERIISRLFGKTIMKIYHLIRINIVNKMLKF